MSQRSSPPLKLPNSPLIFVLAQIKISPVMNIAEKVPMMQEAFRKAGYPRLVQREIQTTHHRADGAAHQIDTRHQWEFINKEKTASVLVDAEGMTVQVTEYQIFEDFITMLRDATTLFDAEVQPSLMHRVGLRYVDLVVPSEGNSIVDYFQSGLRGFQLPKTESRKAFFSESVCETSANSTFVHRYIEAASGFGFPPDLLPIHLELRREPRLQTPFGLLDLDHYSTHDEDFSVDTAIDQFWTLHEHQTLAFQASVTDKALEEWKTP